MSLTLRQVLIFTAVADTGSTTAASLRVSLSQSATSAALNELERLLRVRLFDRVGKRLVINDSGRALLPSARALLDVAKGIESEFGVGLTVAPGALPPTNLRVGASTTIGNYLLPALVSSFSRDTPNARIQVQIGNTREVSGLVERLEVDMGLIEGPCHEPDVRAEPWIEDELVIVAAPGYPRENSSQRLSLKSLSQANWLLREPGSGTREAVEHALLPHLHQLREPLQFGSTEAIKQAAVEGLGLTCLSFAAVRDFITLGRLQVLETALPRLKRRFYLIYHNQKQFSASLERFIIHCRARAPGARPSTY
jgi:DNA-binding transcriptional LysR family regulator